MNADEFSSHLTLQLSKNGNVIMDEEGARLLILIDELGSILAASKRIGMPYSRAWEYISRIERLLSIRVIESRRGGRGGGGTKLTEDGRKLVNKYLLEYKKHLNKEFYIGEKRLSAKMKMFIYAGSNDILLEHILGMMKKKKIFVESYWIGSLKGLASLILDECDLTGIHLFDNDTGEYNVSYVKKYAPTEELVLVRGYNREIGFITHEKITYEDIIDKLVAGKLKMINRNRGSGTRLITDAILKEEATKRSLDVGYVRKRIRGYKDVVYTHIDLARKIALREADVGIGLRLASEIYKLNFIHITWEKFDFATRNSKINEKYMKDFIKILKSSETIHKAHNYKGYRVTDEVGSIVNI